MASSNHTSSTPTTFAALAAFCEPCYCDRCAGAEKLRGDPCEFCGEPQWGCRNMLCPCVLSGVVFSPRRCACGGELLAVSHDVCADCWLFSYRRRYRGASSLQRLWRGYKTRKSLAERNEEEVRAMVPLWRYFDDTYRMYTFCQTLNCELKKDDAEFDPTKTPYYIWMLEHSPQIEEMETYMRRRGWVRPKKKGVLNTQTFKHCIRGVLVSCGIPLADQKVTMALYDTFVATR